METIKNMKLQICVFIYLILILIIMLLKDKFYHNGELKHFGTGENKTVFPLWLMIIYSAFVSIYLTHLLLLL